AALLRVQVVTQRAAGDGLPVTVHRQLLDFLAQPADVETRLDVEVRQCNAAYIRRLLLGDVGDVQRRIQRAQRGDAASQRGRHAEIDELRDRLVEPQAFHRTDHLRQHAG